MSLIILFSFQIFRKVDSLFSQLQKNYSSLFIKFENNLVIISTQFQSGMQTHSENEECFHVFYTKQINKKKKTYSEGILVHTSASTKLYSSEGQLLTQAKNKSKDRPQIDQQYVLNNSYLVLIDHKGKIEYFKSGKIFFEEIPEPLIQKKQKKKVVSKSKQEQIESIQLESGLRVQKGLFQKLKQHQIEGINFMYGCLNGRKGPNINGCILADYMGLGKTLQTLALSYSMIKSGVIKKFVVVCPLTLLTVWEKQTEKWLGNKIHPLACFGNNGQQNMKIVKNFTENSYRMLIISYETFYKSIQKISGKCDMIVFDQGHRLKNKKSKLLLKLRVFRCQKRILLTGTPIQNNLQQLYTCVSIINPFLFGSQSVFKNIFEKPILQGMSKKATSSEKQLAQERTVELANKLKQFSIRRNTDILEKYLPLKNEYLIFLQLTPLQKQWYKKVIQMSASSKVGKENNETSRAHDDMFKTLNYLRKLFTHPLILKSKKLSQGQCGNFLECCESQTSPKVQLAVEITKLKVTQLHKKVVIVSYYTETLDFIAQRLKLQHLSYVRLDGKMKSSERKNSLFKFQHQGIPILLLSGKAGGTGLTLTCATTMILMEPDWNPANDAQVMARIWRQGQTEEVEIFRLIIACSFEEKMLQRQGIKNSLAATLIDDQKNQSKDVDYESLGQLFIDNRQQVLSYSQSENTLNDFVDKYEEVCSNKGIIFVKQKCSHDKDGKLNDQKQIRNQFESINLSSIKNQDIGQINGKNQQSDEDSGILGIEEKNEDSLDPTEYDSDSSVTESEEVNSRQMKKIECIEIKKQMQKQEKEEEKIENKQSSKKIEQECFVRWQEGINEEKQDKYEVKQVNRYKNGKREVENLQQSQKPRTNILCKIKNRKI